MLRTFWVVLVSTLLVGRFPTIGVAQSQLASASLSVSTAKETLLVGEALKLSLRLTNPTATTLILRQSFSPESGALGVSLIRADGTSRSVAGPGWGVEDSFGGTITLAPGATRERELSVLFNSLATVDAGGREFLVLSAPGVYKVVVEMSSPTGSEAIESNQLAITVLEPTGIDKEVFDQIANPAASFFLETAVLLDPQEEGTVVGRMQNLLTTYPSSAYSESIRVALERYSRR